MKSFCYTALLMMGLLTLTGCEAQMRIEQKQKDEGRSINYRNTTERHKEVLGLKGDFTTVDNEGQTYVMLERPNPWGGSVAITHSPDCECRDGMVP